MKNVVKCIYVTVGVHKSCVDLFISNDIHYPIKRINGVISRLGLKQNENQNSIYRIYEFKYNMQKYLILERELLFVFQNLINEFFPNLRKVYYNQVYSNLKSKTIDSYNFPNNFCLADIRDEFEQLSNFSKSVFH